MPSEIVMNRVFHAALGSLLLLIGLNTAAAAELLSRDEYAAAKPGFAVVPDQSVFDRLFEDGSEFDYVSVESLDDDEGTVIGIRVKGRKFFLQHPAYGNHWVSFKRAEENQLKIYWNPHLVYTYEAACGTIDGEKHCALMDGGRMAWGFRDPR